MQNSMRCCAALSVVLFVNVTNSPAADQLYLSTNNATNSTNDVHLLQQIQRGVFSLGSPGAISIKSRNIEQDGGVPAGFGLTTVRTTDMPLAGGAQVVLGTTNGFVLTYDANLNGRVHATDICDGCGKAAQEVAVGQFGPNLNVASVASGYSLEGISGFPDGGVRVVTYNENMERTGELVETRFGNLTPADDTGPFTCGTQYCISDLDVTGLDFGEMDVQNPGNELAIGLNDNETFIKWFGRFGGFRMDPTATPEAPKDLIGVWDASSSNGTSFPTGDGNVDNGIVNPYFHARNSIAQIRLGDVRENVIDLINGGLHDELIHTGNTNDSSGTNRNEGPHHLGTHTHLYTPAPPTEAFYNGENGGDHDDVMTSRPMLSVAFGDLYDGDSTAGANYSGDSVGIDVATDTEFILVGIGQIRIFNGSLSPAPHTAEHNTVSIRGHIETGEHIFHVEVADVLNDDGVEEIIVATSDEPYFDPNFTTDQTGIPFNGGRILIYEHLLEGDRDVTTSPFVHDPLGENGDPRGATIEFGPDTWITGLAFLDESIIVDPPVPGDFNSDRLVEIVDLNLVLFNWNASAPVEWTSNIPAGLVGVNELNAVLFNWGTDMSLQAVPEPTSLVLTVLSLISLGSMCQRKRSLVGDRMRRD